MDGPSLPFVLTGLVSIFATFLGVVLILVLMLIGIGTVIGGLLGASYPRQRRPTLVILEPLGEDDPYSNASDYRVRALSSSSAAWVRSASVSASGSVPSSAETGSEAGTGRIGAVITRSSK